MINFLNQTVTGSHITANNSRHLVENMFTSNILAGYHLISTLGIVDIDLSLFTEIEKVRNFHLPIEEMVSYILIQSICTVGVIGSRIQIRTEIGNRTDTRLGIYFIRYGKAGKVYRIDRHTSIDIVSRIGNAGNDLVITAQLGCTHKDIVLVVRAQFIENGLGQRVYHIAHRKDLAI